MEAFSLLRYWRSNGGDATSNANERPSTASATATATATTIVTAVSSQTSEDEDEVEDDENDHGPFFDLEFSLPAEGDEEEEEENAKDGETGNGVEYGEEDADGSEELEDDRELKFTLLSGSSGDSTADANVSVSPSDDLFFKGSFVPVEEETEVNSKPSQSRVSLMKSATKFRVMMLKFKKSKSNSEWSESTTESNASGSSNSKEERKKDEEKETADQNGETEDSGKSMTVKFKLEEVPIVSLFKRHNSSKAPKKRQNDDESISSPSEEKKFSKETMQRYLRKVKPLYFRVSKRYGEKLKFTGHLNLPGATKQNIAPSPTTVMATEEQKLSSSANPRKEKESTPEVPEPPLLPSNAKGLKQGNLPAGLRVVCKHLGKSRSASTAVAATPPGTASSKRRDDSLLQQQDGIQSAILHCKRSFKASRDSDCSSSLSGELAPEYGKCENSWSPGTAAGGKETEEINKSDESSQKVEKSYGFLGF